MASVMEDLAVAQAAHLQRGETIEAWIRELASIAAPVLAHDESLSVETANASLTLALDESTDRLALALELAAWARVRLQGTLG